MQLRCDSSSRHVYQPLMSKRLNHVSPTQTDPQLTLSRGCRSTLFMLLNCSVAKSYPVLCDPHGLQHARLPCPSLAPGACSNSCSLSQWCYLTITFSATLFSSCPQSFPASGSFPVSRLFESGGQSSRASASASIFPMNIQGWFPLEFTGLISFLSKGPSGVFSSTTMPPSPWLRPELKASLTICSFISHFYPSKREAWLFPQNTSESGHSSPPLLPSPHRNQGSNSSRASKAPMTCTQCPQPHLQISELQGAGMQNVWWSEEVCGDPTGMAPQPPERTLSGIGVLQNWPSKAKKQVSKASNPLVSNSTICHDKAHAL